MTIFGKMLRNSKTDLDKYIATYRNPLFVQEKQDNHVEKVTTHRILIVLRYCASFLMLCGFPLIQCLLNELILCHPGKAQDIYSDCIFFSEIHCSIIMDKMTLLKCTQVAS